MQPKADSCLLDNVTVKFLLNDGRHCSLNCDLPSVTVHALEDQVRFEFGLPQRSRVRLIHAGQVIRSSNLTLNKINPPLLHGSTIHCTFSTVKPLPAIPTPSDIPESSIRGFARLLNAGVSEDEVLITRLQFYIFRQRALTPDAVPCNRNEMLRLEDSWIDNSLDHNNSNSSLSEALMNIDIDPSIGMTGRTNTSSSRLARVMASELRSVEAETREFHDGDSLDFLLGFLIGFSYLFGFVFLAFEQNLSKEFRLGMVFGVFGILTFSLLRFWSFAGF
ncbi:hypothetical protein P9112_001986 [Eukaryota sp. TZLM1-RC]